MRPVRWAAVSALGLLVAAAVGWAVVPRDADTRLEPNATAAPAVARLTPERLDGYVRRADEAGLMCGVATVNVRSAAGAWAAETSLSTAHVFGPEIPLDDLLALHRARAAGNFSEEGRPLDPAKLVRACYCASLLLAAVPAGEAVGVLARSLDDDDRDVRAYAAIALVRMGDAEPSLRAAISKVRFPEAVLTEAKGSGVQRPDWLRP